MSSNLNQTLLPDSYSYSGDITRLLTCMSPGWEGKIEKTSDTGIKLNPINKGCGLNSSLINLLVTSNRRPIITQEDAWTLDTSKTAIDSSKKQSGIIDGYELTSSMFYHLWYFLDETLQAWGYGLTKQPKTTCTALSQAVPAGSSYEFPVSSKQGWQFTPNAKVSVYVSDEAWNSGTITSVSSESVTIALDDYNSFSSGSSPVIIQWGNEYLKPWDISKSQTNQSQTLISDYYLLCGENQVYINSSGNLQLVYNPGTGFNVITWWDENITDPAMILHPDYMHCDGNLVLNPLSPMVGTTLRDLISNSRFIRAGSISGDAQDAHIEPHSHTINHGHSVSDPGHSHELNYDANNNSGTDAMRIWIANTSNYTVVNLYTETDTTGVTVDNHSGSSGSYGETETRPVNISMVPIVKVVP